MFKKFESLQEIKSIGNCFDYKLINPENLDDVITKEPVTVRFDREEHIEDLPFYVFRDGIDCYSADSICKEAKKLGCWLLRSNGLKELDYQVMNFVYNLNLATGEYLIEYSKEKVTLREMYKNTTYYVRGNLWTDEVHSGSVRNLDIKYILDLMFSLNISNKYVEATLFSKPVGIKNKPYVIWQMR